MTLDLSFNLPSNALTEELIGLRKRLVEQAQVVEISQRYKALSRLEAFGRSREYEHRSLDWFGFPATKTETISTDAFGLVPTGGNLSANKDAPMHAKRPTAPLRLAPRVVKRFTSLIFGAKRKPAVTIEGDDVATDFITAAFKAGKFWRSARMARRYGGEMGSVLFTISLENGRFVYKAHNPKTVQAIEWVGEPLVSPVSGVLIQYTFSRMVAVRDPKTGAIRQVERLYLYRRMIDSQSDVRFKAVEIRAEDGVVPALVVDSVVHHGLGYFPGVWVQNLPDEESMDGVPDCEGGYQAFETVDVHFAQIGRALARNLDPTLMLSRDPKLDLMGVPVKVGGDNAINVGPGGSASYLEYAGAVLATAKDYASTIRAEALSMVQCTDPDPTTMAGAAQSALAIELLNEPMFQKADELRDQYEEIVETSARVTLDLARTYGNPERYPGRAVVKFALPPKIIDGPPDPTDPDQRPTKREVLRHPGVGSSVTVTWGEFVPNSVSDNSMRMSMAVSAVAGEILDRETAIETIVAPALGYQDVAALKLRVKKEVDERTKQEAERDRAMSGPLGGLPSTIGEEPKIDEVDEERSPE